MSLVLKGRKFVQYGSWCMEFKEARSPRIKGQTSMIDSTQISREFQRATATLTKLTTQREVKSKECRMNLWAIYISKFVAHGLRYTVYGE